METFARPGELPQTAIDIYHEYARAWKNKSGGARIDKSVLPLIVVTARKLDALRDRIEDMDERLENRRSVATVDTDPPKKRPMTQAQKDAMARGREKARMNRKAAMKNG